MKVLSLLHHIFLWWKSEISEMLPYPVLFALFGAPHVGTLVFLKNSSTVTEVEDTISVPSTLLTQADYRPITVFTKTVIVNAILPQSACLVRDVFLPKMNEKNLRQAITLDTQRATPFQQDQIFWTYVPIEDGKVRQCIFRRADAIQLRGRLADSGIILKKLMVQGGGNKPLVDFSSKLTDPYRFWRKINIMLIIILFAMGGGVFWRPVVIDRADLAQVNQRITELRETALILRTKMTEIEGAQEEKLIFLKYLSQQYMLADLLRELTIRLPDTVWLSSLQFTGAEVIINGTVKGSAAELVLTIAESGTLINPSLSGAVSTGQVLGTESFEITTTILQDMP